MRRVFITLLMVVIGLLAVVSAGSSLAANLQSGQAAPAGPGTNAATKQAKDESKSPPPADRGVEGPTDPNYRPHACVEPVVNVSATSGNHAESHIVINPTNPLNLVAFSNISGSSTFRGYSTDGGATWTRGNILPGIACCDAQAVFDRFGTLFMVYINGSVNQINVIASTDGGVTFTAPLTVGSGSIDQPSIAVGQNSVWVDWNQSGSMRARGAPISGLGIFGPFNATQTPPGATGSFGGIAVGPNDVPIIVYQNPTGGQGPATISANVDADGLGAGNFGPAINVTSTNVGGFDFIPAQSGRSIDSEAGVVWDYTGGTFNGRIYLVYTEETIDENNDTEIYVRTSTNSGTTWSAPVRVNDDPVGPIRSQFLPYITLDRSSGTVAVGFHDARNDNGVPGSGGTNAVINDDSEYYATYTTDGGATWAPNERLSGGFSNDNAAGNGVDYGDYVGTDAYGGKFVGMWADNANCDGTNPDGTLHQFDLYMGIMNIPGGGTPTPTVTGTPPTNTPTITPTNTPVPPSATPTVCGLTTPLNEGFEAGTLGAFTSVVGTCVPGGCGWSSVASNPHTGTRSAFAPDPNNISDQYLEQTTGIVVSAGSTLTFWHRYDTESGFDGGVLEATTNNGATWTDMEPNITVGGYDGPISTSFGSPIGGRNAWNGSHTTYSQVSVNLSPYAGQTLRIRFRMASDNSVAAVGWNVDDVVISVAGPCATNTSGPSPTTTSTSTSTSTNTSTSTPIVPPSTSTITPTAPSGTPSNTSVPPTATNTPSTATSEPATPTTEPATAIPTSTVCPVQFTDVPANHTFYDSIRCLACRGIINGYSSGCETGNPCFRPGNNVTRGQLAKIVSNSAGFTDPATTQQYQDVPVGSTFYDFIYRLTIRTYVNGYPCGGPGEPCVAPGNLPYFRPNSPVTRGQLSKIVSNGAGFSEPAGPQQFQDVAPGSTFYDFIWRLTDRGVMTGYVCGGPGEPCIAPGNLPYFRPGANATRGQASKIVANTFFPGCDTPR